MQVATWWCLWFSLSGLDLECFKKTKPISSLVFWLGSLKSMLSTGACELGNKLKFPGPGLAEAKCVAEKSPEEGRCLGSSLGLKDSWHLVSTGSLRTHLSDLPAGEMAWEDDSTGNESEEMAPPRDSAGDARGLCQIWGGEREFAEVGSTFGRQIMEPSLLKITLSGLLVPNLPFIMWTVQDVQPFVERECKYLVHPDDSGSVAQPPSMLLRKGSQPQTTPDLCGWDYERD